MLLSAVSVLVVEQSSSEIPEGLMNNPVCMVNNVRIYEHVRTVKIHHPPRCWIIWIPSSYRGRGYSMHE